MLEALAEIAAEHAQGGRRRRREVDRPAPRPRQAAARERIELLLDQDAPFLELSPLAGWGTEFTVGGSVVTGIGVVRASSA